MRTKDELAEEYANQQANQALQLDLYNAFIAGYEAGHEKGFESCMLIHEMLAEYTEAKLHQEMLADLKGNHKFACKLHMIWERAEDYSASKWLKNDSRYAKETTREYTIARDAYYQGYLAAEKRTAWIATADTLPVNDEDVLVLCDGKVYLSYYEQPGYVWTVGGNVTHWMPLPKPPKVK